MNKINRTLAIVVSAIAPYFCCPGDTLAQTMQGPLVVTNVYPPDAARQCALFQLQGVTIADPGVPGNPWFAIPMTNVGFHEQFALLLTAAFNNHQLMVHTAGATVCNGFPQVDYIYSTFP